MTDIFGSPSKIERKRRLFEIGIETLQSQGWTVEKVRGSGKSSLRRITKGRASKMVAIRTTQDRWISFPRLPETGEWRTLSEVDLVAAVSVDDKENPRFGLVHLLDQVDITDRFNRAFAARLAAGRTDPGEHGVWISLYDQETNDPVSMVGAGAGRASPEIARVALDRGDGAAHPATPKPSPILPAADQQPLTIAEAKRRLAITFGVDPSAIKITVEA